MRDALETPRTNRYRIGTMMAGRTTRSSEDQAGITAQIAAGSLVAINVATFGLYEGSAADDSVSITSASDVLTSTSNLWAASDVGKMIDVAGAGAAGGTLTALIIGYTNPGQIQLGTAASTTIAATKTSAAGLAVWGTPLGSINTSVVLTTGDTAYRTVPAALALAGVVDVSGKTVTPDTIGAADTLEGWVARFQDARSTRGIFTSPAALGHRIGTFRYRVAADGRAELLTSLDRYMPAAGRDPASTSLKVYYVDPTDGNDASAGTAWATALKSIKTALAKVDVDAVICRGGKVYAIDTVNTCMDEYSANRDVSIIAEGPRAIMSTHRLTTWTVDGVLTNVYNSSSTGGTIVKVLDPRQVDAYGDFVELTNVASKALVDVTPGSWFYAANVLSVRLSDSAIPNSSTLTGVANCFGLRALANRVSSDTAKVFIKNFHFIGGSGGAFSVRDATAALYVTMEDCWGTSQYNSNGFDIKECGIFIAIRCRVSANFLDGFNYHLQTSVDPHFIEIDCVGLHNGTVDSDNGSTSHEACRGIRLNCDYAKNTGPGCIDVNTAKALNVNCTSKDNGPDTDAHGFEVQGTAESWLLGCAAAGNGGSPVKVGVGTSVHWLNLAIDAAPSNAGTMDNNLS